MFPRLSLLNSTCRRTDYSLLQINFSSASERTGGQFLAHPTDWGTGHNRAMFSPLPCSRAMSQAGGRRWVWRDVKGRLSHSRALSGSPDNAILTLVSTPEEVCAQPLVASSHRASFHNPVPLVPALPLPHAFPPRSMHMLACQPQPPLKCTPKERSPGKQMFFFSSSCYSQSSVACGGLRVGRAAGSCEADPVWARFSLFWLEATRKRGGGTCPEELSVHQLSLPGEILDPMIS